MIGNVFNILQLGISNKYIQKCGSLQHTAYTKKCNLVFIYYLWSTYSFYTIRLESASHAVNQYLQFAHWSLSYIYKTVSSDQHCV